MILWPKFFDIMPKWWNFAKPGHTGDVLGVVVAQW